MPDPMMHEYNCARFCAELALAHNIFVATDAERIYLAQMGAGQHQRRAGLWRRVVGEVESLHIEGVRARVDNRIGMPVLGLAIATFDDMEKGMIVDGMRADEALNRAFD